MQSRLQALYFSQLLSLWSFLAFLYKRCFLLQSLRIDQFIQGTCRLVEDILLGTDDRISSINFLKEDHFGSTLVSGVVRKLSLKASALALKSSQFAFEKRCTRCRLFHAPTRTTSSGCFMLHRTVHALWNLYGNPYRNRAETKEETIP